MAAFASRARLIGDEMYPRICGLLSDGHSDFPRAFDVSFRRSLSNGKAGETSVTQIRIGADNLEYFTNHPGAFDQLFVHEMAHVAQSYYRPLLGGLLEYHHRPPFCWTEGIADYVCFRLGQTNVWVCPECDWVYPHYLSGYSCAGAFLLYAEDHYNPNLVRQLNTLLRRGGYSDRFFLEAAGKDLQTLWTEFQQTAAFVPTAADMLELQQSLGFVDGKPPKDFERRFQALLSRRTDPPTRQLFSAFRFESAAPGDIQLRLIQPRLAAFLYLTQPGGSAEAFLLAKDRPPPGFAQGDQGNINYALTKTELQFTYPATRSLTLTKRGDTSTYHYTVYRASRISAWSLQRAWRTTPDGQTAEEYPVR